MYKKLYALLVYTTLKNVGYNITQLINNEVL